MKNKQSAKKTRNKKKMFVELLESKIRELEDELNFIKN
jgi:Basic region leucine zipper